MLVVLEVLVLVLELLVLEVLDVLVVVGSHLTCSGRTTFSDGVTSQ